jgi:carbon storage regulator CsrA
MLILVRRIGETIVIGDVVATVTVLRVKGSNNGAQVGLGINAARAIPVLRGEQWLSDQRKKKKEADGKP